MSGSEPSRRAPDSDEYESDFEDDAGSAIGAGSSGSPVAAAATPPDSERYESDFEDAGSAGAEVAATDEYASDFEYGLDDEYASDFESDPESASGAARGDALSEWVGRRLRRLAARSGARGSARAGAGEAALAPPQARLLVRRRLRRLRLGVPQPLGGEARPKVRIARGVVERLRLRASLDALRAQLPRRRGAGFAGGGGGGARASPAALLAERRIRTLGKRRRQARAQRGRAPAHEAFTAARAAAERHMLVHAGH